MDEKPPICIKNEAKIIHKEKNILKEIFLYSKERNKLIDLSLIFPVKYYSKKYSLLFEKKNSIENFNILLKIILFLRL